ncbi:MAG: hypothetical protein OXG08_04630 [Gammaproteobacteria bacterium]|nr:hypothetical protein [Gammaproteobacteria bacterium]
MLDDLLSAITGVQERISLYRGVLKQNEIRTRVVLIDPILSALGWNVTDPSTVSIEHLTEHGPVDYALLLDSKPTVIVEAKRLEEPLKKHEMQMLTYAMSQGIKYAVLTDGDSWDMFDVFRVAGMSDKKILSIKLSTMPASSSALKLLSLWNTSLQFGESITPETPVIVPPLTDRGSRWQSLTSYDPAPGSPCPSRLRFWDDSEVELKNWRDFLCKTIAAFDDGHLKPTMLPLGTRNKNHISLEPRNPDGSNMVNPKSLMGTPILVDLKFSAREARRRVRKLLSVCGIEESSVSVASEN